MKMILSATKYPIRNSKTANGYRVINTDNWMEMDLDENTYEILCWILEKRVFTSNEYLDYIGLYNYEMNDAKDFLEILIRCKYVEEVA